VNENRRNLNADLEAEGKALQNEQAELEQEHQRLMAAPYDAKEYRVHGANLLAHAARLEAFLQRVRCEHPNKPD
jgi:hypothetical protein